MIKNHFWKIFAVVGIVLLGGSIIYANHVSSKANEGVVLTAHTKGNPNATVTLTEYSDFECPACGQFYPILKELMEESGDDILFEYKHFPLISIHANAVPAAKAAEAAGQQGKFFEMHDKLFENQQIWSRNATPQAFFITYAEELELDMALFKQHMRASVIEDKINAEFGEARELGLSGTPTFFLNGQRMQFQTYEDFRTQVQEAIGGQSGEEVGDTEAPASNEPKVKFGI